MGRQERQESRGLRNVRRAFLTDAISRYDLSVIGRELSARFGGRALAAPLEGAEGAASDFS